MFTYPALLWFLPILGAVVLIHLINMFRHRRVEWAAMEFLLASYKKSRTRILLQQLLLMLLRTAAVAAVILMFADPKLEGELAQWFQFLGFGSTGTHHIVLLDDSYSMNERNLAQGGTPLFDDALAVIQKIAEGRIAGGGANDRFTLLKLSTPDPVLYELPMNADGVQTIQNTLQQLQPSSFAHEPETMLSAAADLVRQTVGLNPVVYFLSDFRRRNWASSSSSGPTPFLTQIETIRQHGGNVRMIRVAQAEQPNLGIEQLHLVEGIHAADVDILLDATIANYGRENADNVLVTLLVNDQMRSQQTVPRIPAGGKTVPPLRFPVRVSGSDGANLQGHRIEVRLQPDSLPDDNQRYIVLKVPESLEVLLIAPTTSSTSPSSTSDTSAQHVRIALAPGGTRSGILVRQEPPSFLAEKPLEQFSAIFLLDLPTLDPLAIRALENYVANGGGLAMFPGTNTDLFFVREQLYKGGNGLFPAGPVAVKELMPDYLTGAADLHVLAHPIFRLFSDGESPLLGSVVIERYLGVEPIYDPSAKILYHARDEFISLGMIPDPSIKVIASLRNGAPLVVERSFGKGRTMTFLTSASPTWNNWGRNPSFVVVLLELTAYLSKRSEQSQTFLVGDPLTVNVNPMEFEERVRFTPPPREGETSGSGVMIDAMSGEASFTQTDRPGFYTISLRSRSAGEQSELRAVNVSAPEGDIRQLDVTEISDMLRTVRQPLESAAGFSAVSDFAGRQSISDWLLYAVIVFLLGEIFLAGRILPPSMR